MQYLDRMKKRAIKFWRRRAKLSRAEFARRLGVSEPTVWRWEEKGVRPHAMMEREIERVLREAGS